MKRSVIIYFVLLTTPALAHDIVDQQSSLKLPVQQLDEPASLSNTDKIALLDKRIDSLAVQLAKSQQIIASLTENSKNMTEYIDSQWSNTVYHLTTLSNKVAKQQQQISTLNEAVKKLTSTSSP